MKKNIISLMLIFILFSFSSACSDESEPKARYERPAVGWIDNEDFNVRSMVDRPNRGMKSSQSHNEVIDIIEKLIQECDLPEENDPNSGPTLYSFAGKFGNEIVIYGITNHERQNQIVAKLRSIKSKNNWKWIYIKFIDRERWIQKGNNTFSREGEKVVYSTIID